MKSAILVLLLTSLSVTFGFSQGTFVSKKSSVNPKLGVMGGMYFDLSSPKQELCYSIGGRGAAVIDQRWIVGGFAQGNIAHSFNYTYIGLPTRIYTGQGGLWLGRFLFPEKKLNLALSSTFSWGAFGSELRISNEGEPLRTIDGYNSDYYQIAPAADVFVKLAPFLRLSASIGYRFTFGMRYNPIINNTQMNSLYSSIGFSIVRWNFQE